MSCPRTQQASLPACSPPYPYILSAKQGNCRYYFFEVFWYNSTWEIFFFVVWQGVSMIQVRRNKKMGIEGLSFYHPNLLCCLDQMLEVMELSQHLVLSSKTVRPIIPRGARYMGYVKIMWSEVCSLALHSYFTEEARPHLCMNEPKRSTPVRRRLILT